MLLMCADVACSSTVQTCFSSLHSLFHTGPELLDCMNVVVASIECTSSTSCFTASPGGKDYLLLLVLKGARKPP